PLAIYAPRFLPTPGRPRAVALHFIRYDQLMAGLTPAGVRPCWAHKQNGRDSRLARPDNTAAAARSQPTRESRTSNRVSSPRSHRAARRFSP
ncbi:hypothetical protein EVC45_37935, partial [Paraburkholderia sp. UYCP14C]